MKFNSNIELLQKAFPGVCQYVNEIENEIDKDFIEVVSNIHGNITFKVKDQFVHDKKNPFQQARNLIKQFPKIQEYSDILFYGIGMGYHIIAFAQEYPGTPFSIYEPAPEVFYQFLCHADLEQIPLKLVKSIFIENKPEDTDTFCNNFVKHIRSSALVIDLPSYQSIFPEQHKSFIRAFEGHINERRNSLSTVSAFEKLWTINSIKNFNEVFNTPNILLEKKGIFCNKPAVLVASGPSLEEEITNLKLIKEKGLAYIFSAGTSINTLIQHNVYPDAACTYDPTNENQIVCKQVLEKGIKSIPLIFGSTVGYETLKKYPGPKMHMLISQDSTAAFFLKPLTQENFESIDDATTIAVIGLQLLKKLGFNPIILVGQNLAYRDSKHYASGSTFHPVEADTQEMNNAIMVEDVYGNEVASTPAFVRMKQQFEFYLSHYKGLDVINTTKYGALIKGTRFQNLEEIVQHQLNERVVEDSWLETADCSYDVEYLVKQSQIMNNAYEYVSLLLEKCKLDLKNINDLKECGDPVRIGQSYDQFNFSMDRLRNNTFFATIIAPMNRVEMELLMLAVPDISAERNPVRKAEMMEKEFLSYLLKCEQDMTYIGTLYEEMNQSIQQLNAVHTVREKSRHIKVLLVDCDGILTDGAIYYSDSGDEIRRFNYQDQSGILRLHEIGIQTLVINRGAKLVIEKLTHRIGVNTFNEGNDLKQIIAAVRKKYKLEYNEIGCVFNNINDKQTYRNLGLKFAVGNAAKSVQDQADYVLAVNGGEGVIMEIADMIIGQQR